MIFFACSLFFREIADYDPRCGSVERDTLRIEALLGLEDPDPLSNIPPVYADIPNE